MESNKNSGIKGQAQVIFGGAIKIEYGILNGDKNSICLGLSEFKYPPKEVGVYPENDETYCGVQVALAFPNLDVLCHFRDILNDVEEEMKERIKKQNKNDNWLKSRSKTSR